MLCGGARPHKKGRGLQGLCLLLTLSPGAIRPHGPTWFFSPGLWVCDSAEQSSPRNQFSCPNGRGQAPPGNPVPTVSPPAPPPKVSAPQPALAGEPSRHCPKVSLTWSNCASLPHPEVLATPLLNSCVQSGAGTLSRDILKARLCIQLPLS